MPKHDNWINYERAVQDATDDWLALGRCLDSDRGDLPQDVVPWMARAEYALADPITALQEAENWHRARSALLFWGVRFSDAEPFVLACKRYENDKPLTGGNYVFSLARELAMADAQLRFVLAELNARLTAFREIRPQSVGAAGRIAYLEHKHH